MSKYKAGFIGCGNMGGALAKAVALKLDPKQIAVTGNGTARADKLEEEYGVISTSLEDIAKNAKWIFLGVKPQNIYEVLGKISEDLLARKDKFVIVSMINGIKIDDINKAITKDQTSELPIIRIMPNTPVSVGCGMTLYCNNKAVTDADEAEFKTMMSKSGQLEKLAEEKIDAGCAVSGCGPAYVYMFIDAIAKAGESIGLTKEQSLKLTTQTIIGAGELLKQSGIDPDELKNNVCSPGGSTIEGVKSLDNDKFSQITQKAINAAYKRNIELGK